MCAILLNRNNDRNRVILPSDKVWQARLEIGTRLMSPTQNQQREENSRRQCVASPRGALGTYLFKKSCWVYPHP